MGCAYVQKTDIKTNDIDLISGELLNLIVMK